MALTPGFDPAEAEVFLAVAQQLEGPPSPPLTQPPIPSNWTMVFDSQSIPPFDNRWQLWKDSSGTGNYAVVIRGTVSEPGSILEDLLSVMIPASGSITVHGFTLGYQLAADPLAAVHLGFAVGTFITLFDPTVGILVNLIANVPSGSGVFIAGHSQGAAMATICRSFLEYTSLLAHAYHYKSYVFAQPKPGNDHYGDDYDVLTANTGTGFTVNNDQDWVPQVPFTFELLDDINTPNVLSVLGMSGAAALDEIREGVVAYHRQAASAAIARQAPALERLSEILTRQKLVKSAATSATSSGLPILPTLNFVGCGAPIALRGTPGTNPVDPKDGWWQHHAALYYDLLVKQWPSGATAKT